MVNTSFWMSSLSTFCFGFAPFLSCYWFPGSTAKHLPLCFPSSGNCKEQWSNLSASSCLDWTTWVSSPNPHRVWFSALQGYHLCCFPPDIFTDSQILKFSLPSWLLTSTLRSLQPLVSESVLCQSLFCPRCRSQHFSLLNFMILLVAWWSSLSRTPSIKSTALPSVVSPPNFAEDWLQDCIQVVYINVEHEQF